MSNWTSLRTLLERPKHDGRMGHYDPHQPRVPFGNSDGGQWTAGDVQEAPDLPQSSITQRARQLAASRADMKRCIDLCYRLLERFQPPGSDRNFFDFQKCLNACLGVNR